MSEFRNIDEARSFFYDDVFARKNGVVLDELSEDGCVCSMAITDDHRNAAGAVMGGAIFTLADFACAVAANNVHRITVIQNVSINFLSPSEGSRLFARTECRKDGKMSCVYNVSVSDDLGCDIAQYTATGFKLKKQ